MSSIQNTLLKALYERYFDDPTFLSLHSFREENNIDDEVFWDEVEGLEDQKLISAYAIGGAYILNTAGVLFVEENKLADSVQIEQHQQARTQILNRLMWQYETNGKHAPYFYEDLARDLSMDTNYLVTHLRMLDVMGFIEAHALGGLFLITSVGRRSVLEWRAKMNIRQMYLDAHSLSAQKRGKALERIITELAKHEGWNLESNVITRGEELDLVLVKNHAYYLVECKWHKNPIEAKDIRDFYGKLAHRTHYRGLFISMSGFTSGAREHIKSYISHHPIVCFGPRDVEALIQTTIALDNLVEQRYRRLTTQRQLEYE
ncbi:MULTISPECIES: restriction endonuclease [Herpetosiphon]|uniref:Restriction endonuclease type IV Mrr domain-containing protein n=1 Tax=Herpetosiphon gulosus TaxID=1973496 RepID=A0ABP9X7Q6_9CHLR|nr:restriction endonuclease [Herpetosiphon llansteffanensis]